MVYPTSTSCFLWEQVCGCVLSWFCRDKASILLVCMQVYLISPCWCCSKNIIIDAVPWQSSLLTYHTVVMSLPYDSCWCHSWNIIINVVGRSLSRLGFVSQLIYWQGHLSFSVSFQFYEAVRFSLGNKNILLSGLWKHGFWLKQISITLCYKGQLVPCNVCSLLVFFHLLQSHDDTNHIF